MSKQTFVIAFLMLVIGAGAGYIISDKYTRSEPQGGVTQNAGSTERKPLFYRSPMNPEVTSPVPATDNMGMDYIAVYADGGSGTDPSGTVKIDPVMRQNIGVRSAVAEQKTLTRKIRTVGRLDYDEKRVTRLHPKVDGWIEKLYVDTTGEQVKKDSMLLALYSPELVSTEEEYLLALNNAKILEKSAHPDIREGAQSLLRSSLQRLQLFDVPDHQIQALKKSGKIIKNLHIHSPFEGIVINIGIREGQYVTPATELYKIADLSNIWVYVDIYEDEMPWVKTGDMAEMKVTAIPGKTFKGKVSYIYPYLDSKTRTNKVRLEFSNRKLALKPDMFAHVTLMTTKQIDAVVIPSEAIVRTGKQDQVFIVKGSGKFIPRVVTVGISTDGETQIIDGLKAGEEVVTSAQFLIDSESKLNEATAKMLEINKPTEKKDEPEMDMKGMDMKGMDHKGMDMKDMDHKGMDMKGMDHKGMDMKDMDHKGMDMKGMDHKGMDMKGMDMKGMEKKQ